VRVDRAALVMSKGFQRVVETVCQAPAKGLSRWSARTLARHLDIPSATVNRILRENQLQPHRLRTFTFSPDPQFGESCWRSWGFT